MSRKGPPPSFIFGGFPGPLFESALIGGSEFKKHFEEACRRLGTRPAGLTIFPRLVYRRDNWLSRGGDLNDA
jgi:hypothetical protein